jgi:hypothetical protein
VSCVMGRQSRTNCGIVFIKDGGVSVCSLLGIVFERTSCT